MVDFKVLNVLHLLQLVDCALTSFMVNYTQTY